MKKSQKKSKAPHLKTKLHTSLTHVKSCHHIVKNVRNNVNTGQLKRKEWIGRSRVVPSRKRFSTSKIKNTPAKENQRALNVHTLRKLLTKLCGKDKPPPLLTFERWILESLEDTFETDPLLEPIVRDTIDFNTTIVRDLIRASIAKKQALKIAQTVQSRARALLKSTTTTTENKVKIKKHKHTSDITFGKTSKRILKINHEHYKKMYDLWSLYNEDKKGDELFLDELYMMLSV